MEEESNIIPTEETAPVDSEEISSTKLLTQLATLLSTAKLRSIHLKIFLISV